MIIKINACKIELQQKIKMFVWDCDNLIENKLLKSIQNQPNIEWWSQIKNSKNSIKRNKIGRWDFKKETIWHCY